MRLTLKQKRFADEYIISGNATEAYLKNYAKQSRASAEANARKLLGNYSVKTYIEERLEDLDDEKIASQKEVLQRLTAVARREEKEVVVVTVTEEAAEWVDGRKNIRKKEKPILVEIPAKLTDTNKALELLGKRYRLWTDKVELDTDMNILVKVDYGTEDIE